MEEEVTNAEEMMAVIVEQAIMLKHLRADYHLLNRDLSAKTKELEEYKRHFQAIERVIDYRGHPGNFAAIIEERFCDIVWLRERRREGRGQGEVNEPA